MLWSDLRHSMRGLARMPGFTLICMLTLALGIGATTSIFSAIYHVMLRPMPFANGDRIAYVWVGDSASGMSMSPPPSYLDAWRGRLHSFDALESYNHGEYTLLGGTEPELIEGAAISAGLPAMLGVAPMLGRGFTSDEMQRNGRNVVLLSEGLWKRRFAGSRGAIGKQIQLADGKQYEIIGVLPNVFAAFESYQHEGQLWLPLRPDTGMAARNVNVIGVMKTGVTPKAAGDELGVIANGVKAEMGMPGKWAPKVMTPQDFLDGTTQTGLPILLAAVAVVLLIGCANIAGLLLVRLNSRRRELSIRAAVGARRGSIVRLLIAEAFLLAAGGGILGIIVASWITNAIRMLRPDTLNSLDAITTDRTSIVFAIALSLLTAIFFGVAPIIAAMRRDLTGGLINNAGASTRVTSGNRMRSIMVGGQIAMSLILLVASLLLVRSVKQMQHQDLGIDPTNVLTFNVHLRNTNTSATTEAFFNTLVPALRRLPGVTAVSLSTGLPSDNGVMFGEVTVPGRTFTEAEKTHLLGYTGVTPGYLNTVGLRLREGRFLLDKEDDHGIVINESWAKKLWPKTSALGHEIHIGDMGDNLRIVGVVEDEGKMGATGGAVWPHIFMPYSYDNPQATIAMRTDGRDPSSLVAGMRAALHTVDPTLVPRDVASLEHLMSNTIALDRFYMQLLSAFAGLALLLSAIGLYGVISNTVAQRTREIGVRMALGATAGDVQSLVLRHAFRIVLIGLVIGAVAAWGLARFLTSALHGFSEHDPVSFGLAALVLTLGAGIATWLPARRAVRVDPLTALRTE